MSDYTELCAVLDGRIRLGELMSNHTTFHIGGAAEALVCAASPDDVIACASYCRDNRIPFTVVGNGSNVLVLDGGVSGVVVKIADDMGAVSVEPPYVAVQAGASVSRVSLLSARAGLAGLEFAGGIPGTVGGAVAMNAGAYGGEMSQTVVSVTAMAPDCTVKIYSNDELDFAYRYSRIQTENLTVLSATLRLWPGDPDESLSKIKAYNEQRREKQPLKNYSAGSTFKRPANCFAAKVIEDAGLKGRRVGGAEVSRLHSGFIINHGDATAADVLSLIEIIKETVFEKFGVVLEPEIHIIGNR